MFLSPPEDATGFGVWFAREEVRGGCVEEDILEMARGREKGGWSRRIKKRELEAVNKHWEIVERSA